MRKALLVSGIVGTVGLAGIASAATVAAATDTTGTDPMSSLVEKISSKFNLNKTEVQAVFDEQRTAHEAERTEAMKERLATAVKDGKLTQAQADKIAAKRAEMKTFMESMKGKTEAERRTAMESNRDSMKQWADDNDIPEEYMQPGGRGHGPGDPR